MNNTSGGRSKYSKSSLTCSQAHTTPKERTRIILIQTIVSIYTELMTRFLHSWIICTLQRRILLDLVCIMRSTLSLLALGITLGSTLVTTTGQSLNLKSIRAVDRSVTNKDTWKMKGSINDPSLTIVPTIGQKGLTVELQDATTDLLNTVTFAARDCRVPAHGKRAACKIRGARVFIKTSRRPKINTPKTVHAKRYNSTGGYYSVTGTFRRLTFLENPVVSPLTAALTVNESVLSDTLTSCYDLPRKNGRNPITHCEPGPPVPTPIWTEQIAAGSREWFSIASSSDGTNLAAVVFAGSIWTSTDAGVTWTERLDDESRFWVSIASSSDGTVRVWMEIITKGARCSCPRLWSHRVCMSDEGSPCDARSDASWSTTHPTMHRALPPW
ncbi:hypothetical protein Naga_101181g1 [Nannochloropsis gaditana]|uniref:Uncharacterized protein n=1 Tax=Nannochloropsis gaditana TaxID=72520 RepID=W7TMU6_9STRA|nr:hypothetical protein Naga_101181g1 [Nannochloropsis gaditana]